MMPHEITLKLHPEDMQRLRDAAASTGYSVDDYARLALHLASKATLGTKADLISGLVGSYRRVT